MNLNNFVKLNEAFTEDEFKSQITDKVNDICNSTYSYDLSIGYFNLVNYVIYEWYKRTRIAYEDKAIFVERMVYDLVMFCGKNTKLYDYYIKLLTTDDIKNKGDLLTDRNVTLNQNNSSFTKQASTPTTIAPTENFVDTYTNYQSDTSRGLTSNDNYNTTIKRTYGELDIMSIYSKIPNNLFTDLIHCVAQNFITYDDLERLYEGCEI